LKKERTERKWRRKGVVGLFDAWRVLVKKHVRSEYKYQTDRHDAKKEKNTFKTPD